MYGGKDCKKLSFEPRVSQVYDIRSIAHKEQRRCEDNHGEKIQ